MRDGGDGPIHVELVDAGRSDGAPGPCLVWRLPHDMLAISSSMVGGGIGPVSWVLNMTVDADYGRLDPDDHLVETAHQLGLTGRGAALMTAVDVSTRTSASIEGAEVWATVGASRPTWAADRSGPTLGGGACDAHVSHDGPGTINVVASVPVLLSESALVNVVATIAEAKVQALLDHDIDGTGTASDAVTVMCLPDGVPELFGGPRSTWGSKVATATYRSISAGLVAQRAAVDGALGTP